MWVWSRRGGKLKALARLRLKRSPVIWTQQVIISNNQIVIAFLYTRAAVPNFAGPDGSDTLRPE